MLNVVMLGVNTLCIIILNAVTLNACMHIASMLNMIVLSAAETFKICKNITTTVFI